MKKSKGVLDYMFKMAAVTRLLMQCAKFLITKTKQK